MAITQLPFRVNHLSTALSDRTKSLQQVHKTYKNNETDKISCLEYHWPNGHPNSLCENIKKTALSHIPDSLRQQLFKRPTIQYLGNQQSPNKSDDHRLYRIISDTTPDKKAPSYLFRVLLPVEPFFKTESEVAILTYLRQKVPTIPVPKVIAYSSSAQNELGFEWIMMEDFTGYDGSVVEVDDKLWSMFSPDTKTNLAIQLGKMTQPLQEIRFAQYGSIYFRDVASLANATPYPLSGKQDESINSPSSNFVIGRIVSKEFYFGNRVLAPGSVSRGPFASARGLELGRLNMFLWRTQNLVGTPGNGFYCRSDVRLGHVFTREKKERLTTLVNRLSFAVDGIHAKQGGTEGDRAGLMIMGGLGLGGFWIDKGGKEVKGVLFGEGGVGIWPGYEGTVKGVPGFFAENKELREIFGGVVGGDGKARDLDRKKRGLAEQLKIEKSEYMPEEVEEWLKGGGYL
ncbi:hypothetical protein QBC38DRAFT_525128 [Podospora fimiseda]|uniref:Aminoglycoside phosphotransferase domain-containing protein n=1 Tax=Podospora fimiseda TaxID=252190 RepID=A0AAN7BR05_9PEZI|nr:hypothetical protein QBC38DRAFT_525128 [Podospora fimiseda]